MVLTDADGVNHLAIRVAGYQFPDAPDPARRFSRHMAEVAGSIAQQGALPGPLRFTEPNLTFCAQLLETGQVRVLVGLDLEYQPPWHQRRGPEILLCLRLLAAKSSCGERLKSGM